MRLPNIRHVYLKENGRIRSQEGLKINLGEGRGTRGMHFWLVYLPGEEGTIVASWRGRKKEKGSWEKGMNGKHYSRGFNI